ncbi:MAG TPA: cell division protein FtsL [Gammaproteobacteria bacterium]|nr:cell division protein FtsL [Gammaproteobacteria bacterium]
MSRVLPFGFLLCAVLGSSVGLVYTKHYSRTLFVELQSLQQAKDGLIMEFGRLQLEQSAWSAHGRVENIAREQLQMSVPGIDAVEMIER